MRHFGSLLLVLSFVSCDIFQPRDPEHPSQSGSDFRPPTEPAIVFANMINAFRDLNSVNYVRSFSDSTTSGRTYVFEPTQQARTNYGEVFQEWTRQSERQYFDNILVNLPVGSVPILEFSNLTERYLQSDSAQFDATYRLFLPHTKSGVPQEARGQSQFFLIADRSRAWSIWRWVDLPINSDDVTWSELKGAFGR